MRVNPFVITFDDEADGGPEHLLYLLIGYGVGLYWQGELLIEGIVVSAGAGGRHRGSIRVREFMPDGSDDGEVRSYPVFDGTFDEVRYL